MEHPDDVDFGETGEDYDDSQWDAADEELDDAQLDSLEEPEATADVERMPSELQFGSSIGPYGTTADSYAEDYYWSTTENAYLGEQTGREIDEWTDTEKKP